MEDMRWTGNSIVVLPTGAGKSIVIAEIAARLDEHVLILQPSKEILEQNYQKLCQYVPRTEIGLFSASVGRKQVRKFTFATIQSVYSKPWLFDHFGLVLIDECHLVNPRNARGMFSSFLEKIGVEKVIGFTASPWRNVQSTIKTGANTWDAGLALKLINRMASKSDFRWSKIIFNVDNARLVEEGFLCPLRYYDKSHFRHSEIPMNKSRTDFDADRFAVMMRDQHVSVIDLIRRAENDPKRRRSILVFCSSIKQATELSRQVPGSRFVDGETPKREREALINDFKSGKVRTVFNMGVLTTGFDHPGLDTIFMLRPTRSLALYYQMLGRGVRTAPGKTDCTVVDFTSNVKAMGKIETIRLYREKRLLDKNPMWYLETETSRDWHNKLLYSIEVTKS